MNFKRILLTLMAAAVAFVSCNQEEELGMANLTVTPGELTFDQSDGTSEVELLATRDWLIASQPDWVAVSVTGGQASSKPQKVSVSVIANSGYNRTGTVVFTIGIMKAALTINQAGAQGEIKLGTGTKEDPYTVAGVIKYVESLGADVASPSAVYVKGKVVAVSEAYSAQYGNGTFTISDDGTPGEVFTCYRILYLGNRKWKSSDEQVKQNDDVIVCGNVVLFKGNTPETSQGTGYLYSLNGVTEGGSGGGGETGAAKGSGTEADPFNVAAAIAKAESVGQTASTDSYYIKGKVKEVTEQFAAQYGNATFTMVDEGYDAVFTAYRVLYFDNQKWTEGGKTINANDEVVVYAKVVNFKGNTPETSGGYVYSINGEKGSGSGSGGGGGSVKEAKAVTVAEFIAAPESNDQPYKLTGKVGGNINTTYGNFDLTDATGTVYVYGLTATNLGYGAKNDQSFGSLGIVDGDEITLIGFRGSYQDKVEVMYAYWVSGGSGTPGGSGGGGGQGGDAGEYSSNVTMTKGNSCYDDNKLNVNGVEGVQNLKFGTSSKYGDGTVVLPAGTKEVTFYAIGWKGNDASLKMTMGDATLSYDVKGNDGASGSGPYNVTVSESDKYSVKFDAPLAADTTVKVETYAGNKKGYRAFLFGVKAVK
ncbi:MAG: BACON domain-containing protein [Bacteroidales bacterium]|nr:BACON domain-containing protein [Bacteroidales bacterium]